MKFLTRWFCLHTYIKTPTIYSERKEDHNYVWNLYFYTCEDCGKSYKVKELVRIERDYYKE